MFTGFSGAILYVGDIQKSKDFYTNILGFKIVEDQGQFATFQIGDDQYAYLAINSEHRSFQMIGKQTISVKCKDIEKLYKRLKDAKIKIFDELSTQPWGKYFAIEDIDGNHIDVTES